ncbi:unnamed protein product [Owenia fusiformis]|uniref:Protein FAM33A n=1 Tax=Owenia fusiformis TaxID=6347 RepID=A0A8J1Y9T5_OWEFU|nr:unnamed protein product [Owenia fusiformis]
MEATVDKLEAMFSKAESDLDYLERKLDNEFSQTQTGEGDQVEVNPVEMLERVAKVKEEFGGIVDETNKIKEAQQEAVEFFKTQLSTLCVAMTKLQEQSGMEKGEEPEELQQLRETLGIELPTNDAPPTSLETATPTQPVVPQSDHQCQSNQDQSPEPLHTSEPQNSDLRAQSSEIIPVSSKEFMSVSSLIRGRVKLEDVNKTYQMIWTRFKEEGKTDPLTPGDMYKMGLKVTGQTGEAKLKVLRALKIVHISNKGAVKLL